MSNPTSTLKLANYQLEPLASTGANYLAWKTRLLSYLGSKGLKHITLDTDKERMAQFPPHEIEGLNDFAIATIMHHLHPSLQNQYMTTDLAKDLWVKLEKKFGDRTLIKPKAVSDFTNIQFSSFRTVSEFHNTLSEIIQRLRHCGEKDMISDERLIDKVLQTMDTSQMLLRNIYRSRDFKTYDDLINQMIADENEEKIQIANATRAAPKEAHQVDRIKFQKRLGPKTPYNKEKFNKDSRGRQDFKKEERTCYKCGIKGHLANRCNASHTVVEAFKSQQPQKNESHIVEAKTNFMESTDVTMGEVYGTFEASEVLSESNCLLDSGTTNTILKSRDFFETLKFGKIAMNTIASAFTAEGQGRAVIQLGCGRLLVIEDAIYQPTASRNLLAMKDLRKNDLHTATADPDLIHILTEAGDFNTIIDTYHGIGNGLYPVAIKPACRMETHEVEKSTEGVFDLWHARVGHPSDTTMRAMVGNVKDFPITSRDFSRKHAKVCEPCATGKFKRAPFKTVVRPLARPLERLCLDLCGPIKPACGPFIYFQVLVDEYTGFIHVSLLSTKNLAFARLLAKIINFKAQYPDHDIKHIRCDNAGEYQSQKFNDYCESVGIEVEYSVPYTAQQNGRAEAANKSLMLVARPLLLQCKLPMSCWGHAILHAAALLNMRSTNNRDHSSIQLLTGITPTAFHLRVFGCAVYVPVLGPKLNKMGPQRILAIYVGFVSKSIIRYIDTATGTAFEARFLDCIFDETLFPTLGEASDSELLKRQEELEIFISNFGDASSRSSTGHTDPKTPQSEIEVAKILSNQALAKDLPDGFNDAQKVIKEKYSMMRFGMNALERVQVGDPISQPAAKKRGRPLGSLNKAPKKIKSKVAKEKETVVAQTHDIVEDQTADVDEQSVVMDAFQQESERTTLDDIEVVNRFSFNVAKTIIEEPDPATVSEARLSSQWASWKAAMETELASITARKVFGEVQEAPRGKTLIGHRWVFVTKRDDKGNMVRLKARLVAKGFSQKYGIDYLTTYSPVMDGTTFRFLIGFATHESLHMKMMDVVTAYLYGSLDKDIYMTVPDGITGGDAFSRPCVKLHRSLYGLKQSGLMWYQRLSEFLKSHGFVTSDICPCVFIKCAKGSFVIIAVYVDDLNIIGTKESCEDAAAYLDKEFEMKDLGPTKFCLGLQLSRVSGGTLMHQTSYTQKMLKKFKMDQCKPLTSPMVVRKLDADEDVFRPAKEGEEILGDNYPYFSAIGALMYLSNQTRPDIAFAVNLLARFSQKPTLRHWNGIKQIFRYLKGTEDMGLFFEKNGLQKGLVGYADAGYQSDPTNCKSQSGYVFLLNGTAISWRSQKQSLVTTSTNHSEIIALYEASRECYWLRSLINHIMESTGHTMLLKPTVLYEDNAACVHQVQTGFIKGDKTKHINPKFMYAHELNGTEIEVTKISSTENVADIFTKSLPATSHWHLMRKMGMRKLRDL